jgi:UDP-2,3-diacylglucosamine hydrolase
MPDLPPFAQLDAPAAWRAIDFISDLHLQASQEDTVQAWRQYMASTPADAVFILGDLFEVWVGDDAALAPGFAAECAEVLRTTATRAALFFMPGNRDFLVGRSFLDRARTTLLDDPTVLQFDGRRWLLTHGDALCLGDTEYMGFRQQVRNAAWQEEFLAKPLAQRQAIARALRQQSEDRKRAVSDYADVDSGAALAWLEAAQAHALVHGHTHRPADHLLGARGWRAVLSDWDAAAEPPRQQVLRLTAAGMQRINLAPC